MPVPAVPFTLQFLFTTLAGLLLGPRLGSLSVGIYIGIGLLGIPVFTSGGGFGYILQPTFGYLLGFYVGTYVTGALAASARQPSLKRLLAANFAGLLLVYLLGMIYYYVVANYFINQPLGVWPLILYCFLFPLPGDLAICFAAAGLGKRLIPILQKGVH
nr:biotin transporter BioY [Sporomusa acidovorans]